MRVVLGPAGKDLYVVGGNGSYLAKPPERSAVPPGWREDRLLRRIGESDGAFGPDRPGGWVCRTDPEGKSFELVAMGFRNPYDLAFNAEGELFTFDSDMEWDAGTPWYRPTRVNHVIDGADFGWRAGTSKWPEDYLDSFGSVVDVGFSSPTGVTFGTGARFPSRYRQALFVADWSYGNIYAVHPEPRGGSYTGTVEPFVSGAPLPVTDLFVRPQDGALYFTVGGRGTTSALYRVTYSGTVVRRAAREPKPTAGSNSVVSGTCSKRGGRSTSPGRTSGTRTGRSATPPAWRSSVSRSKAGAAGRWPKATRALGSPRWSALARREDRSAQAEIVEALGRLDWWALADEDRLDLLRAYELAVCRSFPPDRATRDADRRAARLSVPDAQRSARPRAGGDPDGDGGAGGDPAHASGSWRRRGRRSSRSTSRCAFETSRAVGRQRPQALPRLVRPRRWPTRRDHLRGVPGSDPRRCGEAPQREDQARARRPAPRAAGGGALRRAEAASLRPEVDGRRAAAGRRAQRGAGDRGRGRVVFAAALCYRCHRFEGAGGMVGPDLTGVARRFNTRDLLEAVIEPSRVISDQYRTSQIALKDGRVLTGKIKDISGNTLVLMTDPLDPANLLMVARDGVEEIAWSGSSPMPDGLLDSFTKQDILDLLEFLRSPDLNGETRKK